MMTIDTMMSNFPSQTQPTGCFICFKICSYGCIIITNNGPKTFVMSYEYEFAAFHKHCHYKYKIIMLYIFSTSISLSLKLFEIINSCSYPPLYIPIYGG